MDTPGLIEKLKGDGADSLAAVAVEVLLDTKVGELLPEGQVVKTARAALAGWLASPDAVGALGRVVEVVANRLAAERKTVGEVVAPDVRVALREVVGRPFSPDRKLVLTIIDQEPMRELVRQLLLDAVLEFGRRASAPVAGVAKGLGTLARLAGETVKARSGGLGTLVGAVSGEVERQLERRAVEFVDQALAGVFGQLADAVADPRRAAEAAELRLALLDGVLELTLPQLSRELINLDVPGGARVLRAGLERWLASAEADEQLAQLARFLLERDAGRTVREVVTELGLVDVTARVARESLAARIRSVAAAPAFEAWLKAL